MRQHLDTARPRKYSLRTVAQELLCMKPSLAARFFALLAVSFLFCDNARAQYVLVDNSGDNTISKYDFATGAYLGLFTSYSMSRPVGMTSDSIGNVYVADINLNTIEKFAPDGTHLATFTSPNISDNEGMVITGGYLYSASYNNGKITKFALDGTDLGVFTTVDTRGLQGMVADSAGNIFVTDYNGDLHAGSIQRVATDGSVSLFASMGDPIGIAMDSSSNVYGTDPVYGQLIHKFAHSGLDEGVIVTGAFAYYISMGTNNVIYAPLTLNNTIEKYAADGTDLGAFTTTGVSSPVADIIVVPEPSAVWLLAAGVPSLLWFRRRKH